jgi:hypothetical protein
MVSTIIPAGLPGGLPDARRLRAGPVPAAARTRGTCGGSGKCAADEVTTTSFALGNDGANTVSV